MKRIIILFPFVGLNGVCSVAFSQCALSNTTEAQILEKPNTSKTNQSSKNNNGAK